MVGVAGKIRKAAWLCGLVLWKARDLRKEKNGKAASTAWFDPLECARPGEKKRKEKKRREKSIRGLMASAV
jgi:hypothetical protein